MIVITLALLAAAFAQNTTNAGDDDGNWFDKVKGKVSEILTGAADTCNNKYISGPYIESVLCGSLVPAEITSRVGLTFGPSTPWCSGLACAYRAMGCPEPTYRVEATIIKATGVSESCADNLGITQCDQFAKFVAKNPNATTKKRVADMSAAEVDEAKEVAATALRAYYPNGVEGLDAVVPHKNEKRQGDAILANLQICSPLIALGLQLLESSVKLPVNVSTLLGPCGVACNYALCGLNILCEKQALPLITLVNGQRSGQCPPLTCANFAKAPPSVCEGIACPVAAGSLNSQNCPAPQVIVTPTKTNVNDCCTKCDAPCRGVNCPAITCKEPEWPACIANVVQKYDQFDCCPQCIDPCATKRNACPQPPASCAEGLILGPSRPGDCCLSCQPKCAGISCEGKPQKASDCPAGQQFRAPKNTATDKPTMCADCCGACVAGSGVVSDLKGSATLSSALAASVVLVAALVAAL